MATEASDRFIREGEVVRDLSRHLLWQDSESVAKSTKSWKEADAYCAAVKIGGVTGWRLPTEEELLSIIDFTQPIPAIYDTFKVVAIEDYWTADHNKEHAASVYFGSGCTNEEAVAKKLWVRCVKSQ